MPTNLYGPGDNFSEEDSHVIPGLIFRLNKNLGNKTFEIWGTGTPLREFLHVDDLAYAIKYVIESNVNEDLLNVGSGEEISIKNLSKLIAKKLNYDGTLLFNERMPDGNPRKLLDSSKLSSYGWKSIIDLDTGLDRTIKWFLSNQQ